jgi:dihydroorotate dehydrogenase (fumarate)
MADLKTMFMGLELQNPIVAGASDLVSDPDNLKRMADAGVAAIVYKSLFEEQIQLESLELEEDLSEYKERNAEMVSLYPNLEHAGATEHLMNLRLARKSVNIPLIASLNCVFPETWIDYAKKIQETGVDALELNFYYIPRDDQFDGRSIVEQQLKILKAVKQVVTIPVSVKLSPYYANPVNVIKQMEQNGADGFVIFNRFLHPDIDPVTETFVNRFEPTPNEVNLLPMRFAGLLYKTIDASVCCSGGIYSVKDVIKMILAGADCVQMVSALYKHKISYIATLLKELNDWMDLKNYKTINDFKGKLSRENVDDPYIYKRAQYIDIILQSKQVFKKTFQV